jgi:hypothetical protein
MAKSLAVDYFVNFCSHFVLQLSGSGLYQKHFCEITLTKKQPSCLGANDEISPGAYLVNLLSQKSFRYQLPARQNTRQTI